MVNCISFAADNAAVMQGLWKGVAAFLKAHSPHIYRVGRACHLIHLTAEQAFRQLNLNIADFLFIISYYVDKNSKRKSSLRDIQIMCDADVRKTLKMSSTRWLSLGRHVNRLLQQWDILTLFFFENEMEAAKKKKTGPSSSTKLLTPPSGLTHKPKATLSSASMPTIQPKVSSSVPPKLSTPPSGPTQKLEATLTSALKTPAHLAATFDLTKFIFKQNEIRRRAEKDKKIERTKKEERTDLTKPEKVFQILTKQMSKVYSLFLKRAVPIFHKATKYQANQKEKPCIQILLPTLELQLQKVLISFCEPEHVITMIDETGRGSKPTLYSARKNSQLAMTLRALYKARVN